MRRWLLVLALLWLSYAVGVVEGLTNATEQGYTRGLADGFAKGEALGFRQAAERTGCQPFGTWPSYRVVICEAPKKLR